MRCVVDASLALAWFLPDESHAYANRLLETIPPKDMVVTEFWFLELANGLNNAVRRGRLQAEDRLLALQSITAQPFQMFSFSFPSDLIALQSISQNQNLSIYDATYVYAAHQLDVPLMTLDQKMVAAAMLMGISVNPE